MSKATKILGRILRGTADANINFKDLCAVLDHLGFAERIKGSHHIFAREGIAEILNLRPKGNRQRRIRSSRSEA
jgi:predicted RNA binding protein YcfA (HicA-like mRNA interferase family)